MNKGKMEKISYGDPFFRIFQTFLATQVKEPFALEAQSSNLFEAQIEDQIF